MLVLLIIFMVAAPLATVDVNVDLPGSTAAAQPRPETAAVPHAEDRSHVASATIRCRARRSAAARRHDRGRQADAHLPARRQAVGYGDLMEVMNLLRAAGYLKIALVGLETVPSSEQPAPLQSAPLP